MAKRNVVQAPRARKSAPEKQAEGLQNPLDLSELPGALRNAVGAVRMFDLVSTLLVRGLYAGALSGEVKAAVEFVQGVRNEAASAAEKHEDFARFFPQGLR